MGTPAQTPKVPTHAAPGEELARRRQDPFPPEAAPCLAGAGQLPWGSVGGREGSPPPLPLNPQEVSEQHKDMSANKPNIFRLVPASSSWSHRKGVRFCLPNTIFMHLQGPMFFQNPSCKRVRELWILATQLMILEGR